MAGGVNTADIVWKIMPEDFQDGAVTRSLRGRSSLGAGLIAVSMIGAAVMTVVTFVLFSEPNLALPLEVLALILGIPACGLLAAFLYGIKHVLTRHELSLDGNDVTVCCQPFLGVATLWTEPLANYTCVFAKEEIRGSGKNRYQAAYIDLQHPDPSRSIRLFEQAGSLTPDLRQGAAYRSQTNMRVMWEDFARILGKPAVKEELEWSEAGVTSVTRDVQDLDKPVGELAREGKEAVFFDPHAPVPAGIGIDIDGTTTIFTLTPMLMAGTQALVTGLIVFLLLMFFCLPLGVIAGIVLAWLYLKGPRPLRLYVTPELIRVTMLCNNGKQEKEIRVLSTQQVEEVHVMRQMLTLVTDEGKLPLAVSLSDEGAEWLQNGLLALLAENAPRKEEPPSE